MFTLVLDRSNFYKIKYGQKVMLIQKVLKIPIVGEAYCGKIICVDNKKYFEYEVKVGETYSTICKKIGVEEEELIKLNGAKPVYPSCKIFVPEIISVGTS